MCENCQTVENELLAYLETLIEKYPGTLVQGQKVAKSYHVLVALIHAREEMADRWAQESAELRTPEERQQDAQAERMFRGLLQGLPLSEGN